MTDATPFPLPRSVRQTDVLSGNGGAVYGPFGFKIFDVEDVEVWTRPADAASFAKASVTVAKVSDLAFDTFTVTFAVALPITTEFVVRSARVAERSAGVKSGTRLDADALEKEFSKIAATDQELRRDIERAVSPAPGEEIQVLPSPDGSSLLGWSVDNKLVNRPADETSAGRAEAAADRAEAALAAALPSIVSEGGNATGLVDTSAVLAALTGSVRVTAGTYLVSNSITISADLISEGGVIKPASGVTVTIAGNINAGDYDRIFDGSLGGTVLPSGVRDWSICWWGFYADGSNGAANAAAKAHFDRSYALWSSARLAIYIPAGRYENSGAKDYTDMFVLWKTQTSVRGAGAASTWVKFGFHIMADDCELSGLTAWQVRYGLLLDDESDTSYPAVYGPTTNEYTMPRYGEPVRSSNSITAPNGRRLRSDISDFQAFNCTFGALNLDDSPDTYLTNCRFVASTVDGWVEYKSFRTGDDVGNTHWHGVVVEQSARHNLLILKAGTFATSNCKIFNTATGADRSVLILAKSQTAPNATGYEVIRQVWFNGISLETTAKRTLGITAVADAGSGHIKITLNGPHYIQRGHFFGNIIGTTDYNYSGAVVYSVVSATELILQKASGSFTFTSSQTGSFVLPQIDLWIEGEEDAWKRIIRTHIIGGDCNSFVIINARNVVMKGGLTGKESGYIRKCRSVVADVALGFNKYNSSDARYYEGFTAWNIDDESEVYRSGWYDDFSESYYTHQNGNKARNYDWASGPLERVGIEQMPSFRTYAEYAHGISEVGQMGAYGRDSAGNKTPYSLLRTYAQTITDGAEDALVILNYPRAGVFKDRWGFRNGFYSVDAAGGDPGTGRANFVGYNVGGVAGASGSFTTTNGKTVTVTNGIITAIA